MRGAGGWGGAAAADAAARACDRGVFALAWGATEFAVKNHPLSGATTPQLARILWRCRRHVDVRRYWPRLLFLAALSCLNSVLAAVEWALYARRVAATELRPDPLIVVGQPRTGTTHVHNLLALDTDAFATCSTFHVGFPSCCLWTR